MLISWYSFFMRIHDCIEHTLLKPDATEKDIENLVKEALENNFWGVCVNPKFVKSAKELSKGTCLKVVSVVGFPLSANKFETILFETKEAIKDGADEIDMVINLCAVKEGNFKKAAGEIRELKQICGDKILKVILETDLLSEDEIVKACEAAITGGADFVKTSTGFVKNGVGATVENVKLMHKTVNPKGLRVKASGGIKELGQAQALVENGATRLGTSSGVQIVSKKNNM